MTSDISENFDEKFGLTEFDRKVLLAVQEIASRYKADFANYTFYEKFGPIPQELGWVTSARVRETIGARSLETRRTLQNLAADDLMESEVFDSVEQFRLTMLGERFLDGSLPSLHEPHVELTRIESTVWTGRVTAPQIYQVLQIVSEIEDVAEGITDNEARAQMYGLITALKTLLDLPNPPREGIVALARDPAFGNLIQIGTFLAAIIAAMKA